MWRSRQSTSTDDRPDWPLLRRLQRIVLDEIDWMSKRMAPPAHAHATAPPNGVRVLVVDDNPINLMLISELFSQWRITPLLAADGAEAVALACELRLDLILMDLQMPVLDGIGATQQIRQFEREHSIARVPVVAFTSSAPDRRSLNLFGIDDLLDKPCGIHALQECLQRWCPSVSLSAPSDRVEASRHH